MARKSTSPRDPPRRSPRFSGSSNAPPPPPPLSPPPPYPFATPQQTMAYAMMNDTWSVEAHNGSDDEGDSAPQSDVQVRRETDNSNATVEMVPELAQEHRPIRPLRRERAIVGRPSSIPPEYFIPFGEYQARRDAIQERVPSQTSSKSKGKRKQTADDDEAQQDDDNQSPSKRRRQDASSSTQPLRHINNINPNPNATSQYTPHTFPTDPCYIPYTPLHRSAFPTVGSRKRTRDSEPHHAESSASGVKRLRLSLPDGHFDDHSNTLFNQRRDEKKRLAKLAAALNPDAKPKKIDRATLERTWERVYQRDDLLAHILHHYEQEVWQRFGLDLAVVRQAYLVPDADAHYQWISPAIRQAYPPRDHPAWSMVPFDRLFAWADSSISRRLRPRIESLDRDTEIRAAILSAPNVPIVGFNSAPLPTDDDDEEESVAGPSGTSHEETHHTDVAPSPSPTLTPASPVSTDSATDSDNESEAGTPPPTAAATTPAAPSPRLRRTGAFYGSTMLQALFGYQL